MKRWLGPRLAGLDGRLDFQPCVPRPRSQAFASQSLTYVPRQPIPAPGKVAPTMFLNPGVL